MLFAREFCTCVPPSKRFTLEVHFFCKERDVEEIPSTKKLKMVQQSFAKRIKDLRENARMLDEETNKMRRVYQKDVIEALRQGGFTISKSGYAKWEMEGGLKRPPAMQAISILADFYNVQIGQLIDWGFEPPSEKMLRIDYFKNINHLSEEQFELLARMFDNLMESAVISPRLRAKLVRESDDE